MASSLLPEPPPEPASPPVRLGLGMPIDASFKGLYSLYPQDLLRLIGVQPKGAVTPLNVDVSTVSAAADAVLLVAGPPNWILHLEAFSARDRKRLLRVLLAHVALWREYELPIRTVILLLRRKADAPWMRKPFRLTSLGKESALLFRCEVIRVWELDVETIMNGGLATLPLAPLCRVKRRDLPRLIRRIGKRFEDEAPPEQINDLWAAVWVMLGMRYTPDVAQHLLKGVPGMRESTTYQAILNEGREEGVEVGREKGREEGRQEGALAELRRVILRRGGRRFGDPPAGVRAALEGLRSIEKLEEIEEQLDRASDWSEIVEG